LGGQWGLEKSYVAPSVVRRPTSGTDCCSTALAHRCQARESRRFLSRTRHLLRSAHQPSCAPQQKFDGPCLSRVIFDGFNGGCRQVNVRFYPVSAEPGPGQKRCAWTDPRDSNSQTGGSTCATNSPTMNGLPQPDAAEQAAWRSSGKRPTCPQRHLLGPAIRGTLARSAGSFWPLHDLL
jgi:hypothetical protein